MGPPAKPEDYREYLLRKQGNEWDVPIFDSTAVRSGTKDL